VIVLLAACGGRETLVDLSRPLDAFEQSGRRFTIVGHERGWHHGAGVDGIVPHLPYDVFYVGYTLATEEGLVRGDLDRTWELADRTDADAAWDGLSVERCAADDRVAYRVGDDAWRILVPDLAGAAGGPVPDVVDCDAALAWAGSAEAWRRDRAAHPAVCAHLQRLRLRDEAVRCLLRPWPGVDAPPKRQDLPGALDDPEFWDRVDAAVASGDPSLDPERIRALLAQR
jgi:hypothetical protein